MVPFLRKIKTVIEKCFKKNLNTLKKEVRYFSNDLEFSSNENDEETSDKKSFDV